MFLTLSEFSGCFSKTSRNPGSMPLSNTPVPVSCFSIPSCQNTSMGSIGVGEVAMIELEGIIVRVVSLGGSSVRGFWNLLSVLSAVLSLTLMSVTIQTTLNTIVHYTCCGTMRMSG